MGYSDYTVSSPSTSLYVREMNEAFRMQRHCRVDNCTEEADIKLARPLGQQWINRFLKPYPKLQTIPGRIMEGSRVRKSRAEVLEVLKQRFTEWWMNTTSTRKISTT
jgi:hypothetical protein